MSSVEIDKDIIQPVIAWIKSEHPGLPVIIDRPNVLRPELPYFSLLLITPIQKRGSRDSMMHQNDSKWTIGGQRAFTLAVRSYAKAKNKNFFEPQDLLAKLQDSVEDDTRREDLTKAGLAVSFSSDILDITELLETGFEPRAQLDIGFLIASNRDAELGAIEMVKIEGTFDGDTEPEFDIP